MTPHQDSGLDPPPAPTPTLPPSPGLSDARQICHPHAAGIDMGEAAPGGAVPPGGDPHPGRRFGTCTVDLDARADWLLDCGVTTVARAATGVSGMPLCERWEARGCQVLRMDPRQAQHVPGRPKTDRRAGTWRQRWHTYGLLAGACRPEAPVGVRRSSLRHRQMLLTYAAPHMQHRHKALEPMHRKLTQVVSDSTGVTGRALLTAILAGARDPPRVAQLRTPHGHHDAADIAKALQGTWRAEPRFAFQQARALSAFSHQPMTPGAQPITAPRAPFDAPRAGQPWPPTARRPTKPNDPRCDARTPLSRLAGVDLTTSAGIAAGTAVGLLSEIGTDMTRWPSVQHVWSWRGRGPQHTIAGGKGRARRVRPGAHRVTVARRRAARTLHHAQRALRACCRRRQARLGPPQALTATAHKLARLVSSLWPHGSADGPQGLDASEAPARARTGTARAKQAQALGETRVPLAAQGA